MLKELKEYVRTPKTRFAYAGVCLLLTPLIVVFTALVSVGMSGLLLYMAIRQLITKEDI